MARLQSRAALAAGRRRDESTDTAHGKGIPMGRRLVPLTFWTLLLVVVAWPLALQVQAIASPDAVPILLGTWDGFFHDVDGTGELGLVRSTIDQQVYRRFRGDAALFGIDGLAVFNAINFGGTVAQDDFVTGSGPALTGRVVFQGALATSGGDRGDAAVMVPDLLFTPVRGRAARVPALLLRPFL